MSADTVGWRQQVTQQVAAGAVAAQVGPPAGNYRKYFLGFPPTGAAVEILFDPAEPAAFYTSTYETRWIGPFTREVAVYVLVAAGPPITTRVTPWISINGEIDELIRYLKPWHIDSRGVNVYQEFTYRCQAASNAGDVTAFTGSVQPFRLLAINVVAREPAPAVFDAISFFLVRAATKVIELIDVVAGDDSWFVNAGGQCDFSNGEAGVIVDPGDTIVAHLDGSGPAAVDFDFKATGRACVRGGTLLVS